MKKLLHYRKERNAFKNSYLFLLTFFVLGLLKSSDLNATPYFQNTCEAVACTMTADSPLACISMGESSTTISATGNDDGNVPDGFLVIYVLTFGNDLVIWDVNFDAPEFDVSITGDYRIHKFVYDPETFDPSSIVLNETTGFDVIALIEDTGICASLDPAGATIWVDGPKAPALEIEERAVVLENGSATIEAISQGNESIPSGFAMIFVLTKGEDDVVMTINDTPTFEVEETGIYRIHSFIYDPDFIPEITAMFQAGVTTLSEFAQPFFDQEFCGDLFYNVIVIRVTDGDCDAVACTLTPVNTLACIGNGDESTQISATGNDDGNVPDGFVEIYLLTFGNGLVIWDINPDAPEFDVTVMGDYRIHKFVYDPETFDINLIVLNETTGFDILDILESEGICADLDPNGAFFWVDKPQAGTLTAIDDEVSIENGTATVAATPNGDIVIPSGFQAVYFLAFGTDQIIQAVSDAPSFEVSQIGTYSIHTLVYDPEFLTDLGSIFEVGVSSLDDVGAPFLSEEFCGMLDFTGVQIQVIDPMPVCLAEAGTLTAEEENVALDDGAQIITAIPNGDVVVPDGFSLVYVLSMGEDRVIQETSEIPSFLVFETGIFHIHTLVWDPVTLDLSTAIEFDLSTSPEIGALFSEGGGSICGSLDVPGTTITVADDPAIVMEMFPNPAQGTVHLNIPDGASQRATISIYTIGGSKVMEKRMNAQSDPNQTMDVSNLDDGMYLVRIQSFNKSETHRLIITN